jgi:hypothetical protein
MKRAIWFLLGAALLPAQDFSHDLWGKVLAKHVNALQEFDYAAVKQDPADLNAYVKSLGEVSPKSAPARFPTREAKLAYWINAYNALMVNAVVKAYPVKSVRDMGPLFGVFRKKEHLAGGVRMSLDDIEHRTIRAEFNEPRIHFALVCASVSCPGIPRHAFVPGTLESQLEEAAVQFVRQRRNLEWRDGQLILSSIFKWYGGDFEKNGNKLLDFLKQRVPAPLAAQLTGSPRISYRDYDWNLNAPGSRAKSNEAERELATAGP